MNQRGTMGKEKTAACALYIRRPYYFKPARQDQDQDQSAAATTLKDGTGDEVPGRKKS